MHRTEDAQQGGEGHDKQKLRFQLPLYCEQQKVDVEGEMLFEVQFICQVALQFIRQLANSMSVFLSFSFPFLFACFPFRLLLLCSGPNDGVIRKVARFHFQ